MFVQLADTLVTDFDLVDLLTTLSDRCVELLDVSAAGVMLLNLDGELKVVASSSEAMRLVELYELQAQEGPCLDCYRFQEPVINQHLNNGHRWPQFEKVARDSGFRSVHAFPMRLRKEVIGALNLFHNVRADLSEEDTIVGQALADAATITVLQQRASDESDLVNEQLQHALNSRIVIEQAKGIVAARANLDMEEAFRHLRGYARGQRIKLTDVAGAVIDGVVPINELLEASG